MEKLFVITLFLLTLVLAACNVFDSPNVSVTEQKERREPNDLPKEIFTHWIHSYEDDTEEVKVFRPSDYNFPPARGREGFEIKESGEFVLYKIAPTDGSVTVSGHWGVEEKDTLIIYFDNEEEGTKSYTMRIISCTDDVLSIKK